MATDIKDTAHAVEAAAVMRLLPAPPRLLALGEPTHGEDTLLDLRNELFRQLVEQEGYRSIAIESDCMMGLVVDDYVTTGTGTLDEVMERGFSHGFGASAANRELVRWMRAYNDGRPASERLRFAGFDGPLEYWAASPRQAVTTLHGYLAAWVEPDLLPCTAETLDRLLGGDDRWSNPAAVMDPSQSVGQSAEARELQLLAGDLEALLDARTPHLIAASSRDDWHRARLHARTATGLLHYHFWMAETSPGRMTRMCALRDSMMAANLFAIAERGPALVYAHNGHLQRNKSRMRMGGVPLEWWGAGAIVSAHLGDGYAFLSTALGTIRHHGVDAPPPDTIEGLLYALPDDRYVVDARLLATALGHVMPAPRVSPWFGYSPLDPAHLAANEGIVFVKDVPHTWAPSAATPPTHHPQARLPPGHRY
jgi:erythromycin esterase-like protein